MFLSSARVGPFKSISEPQTVKIDPAVTVFVGMNEAGKTVFLKALEKTADVFDLEEFDPVPDYPRKNLTPYLRRHATEPDNVTRLTYRLTDAHVAAINKQFGTTLPATFEFSIECSYANKTLIDINIDEASVIAALAGTAGISTDTRNRVAGAKRVRAIPAALQGLDLTEADDAFLAGVQKRIDAVGKWASVVEHEVWEWLSPRTPRFMYFAEYDLLPSKMNLAELSAKHGQGALALTPAHRGVLALLRMANIDLVDFATPGGYETLKAKIESVSISLTDQIMEFWKQNEDLEVEVDIKPDPTDEPPYNSGPNLYLRIKNRRHRGVSTPFAERSRGFVWFFSFLVWFDDVKYILAKTKEEVERPLILLLDEPALSLHALAQADFLRYIENLATDHQVLYTTHSPFMIDNDHPERIRVVEDRKNVGTTISEDLQGSNHRTLFPLQAALGWTLAQNLFISERNLVVEGPSELIYLRLASAALDASNRTGLREDVTVVPAGGLDKVVTFVALLGANGLKLSVFHDYKGAPDQKLADLVRQKMISPRAVLDASQFRDLANLGKSGRAADTEDLIDPDLYVDYFCKTFSTALGGRVLSIADLPTGDRIVDRLERWLATNGVQTRPSGGFNHYLVAAYFGKNPPAFDAGTLDRFEALFKAINALY